MYTIEIRRTTDSSRVAPCFHCGVVTAHRSTLTINALAQVTKKVRPRVLFHCAMCWNDATYIMPDKCESCKGIGFKPGSVGVVCTACKGRGTTA